jgi:hypothetical protein
MRSLLALTKSYVVNRLHRALNLGHLEAEIAACRCAAEVAAPLRAGGALYGFIRQGQMVSPIPELTFVCSRGRTGTQWLTEVLNHHPDILAAHGPGSPPFWFPGKPSARIRVVEDQQWHSRIGDLSFSQARAEMRRVGEARHYALVHALTVPELAEKLGKDLSVGRIAVVNLVRHPVSRINSFHAEWLLGDTAHYARVRSYLIQRWGEESIFAHYRERILQKFAIDLTPLNELLFVMACHWLRYDLADFDYPVRHFAFERLVLDRSYLAELLRSSFGPAFVVTDEYLEVIGRVRRRNARTLKPLDARGAYAAWHEWQRYCFSIVFEDVDLSRVYADFDYDFSFIADPATRSIDAGYRPCHDEPACGNLATQTARHTKSFPSRPVAAAE